MASQFITLSIIAIVAFVSPYIASLIPGRPIPETVFLVFAGAFLGPFGLGVISPHGSSLDFLSELGLAFLFLIAGYEIDVKQLTGPMGRHAGLSWLISMIIAVALVIFIPHGDWHRMGSLAIAIAMTTTAYGTLAPILRDRGLVGTHVGNATSVYGAWGELLPILAMTLLLSSRNASTNILVLIFFLSICLVGIFLPQAVQATGHKIITFIRENAETGSQAPVRLTVFLLIFLVTLSAVFKLDAVLGAFAAGFILRASLPDGDPLLETKLEGIAYGFLVPVFFIISGAHIDLTAVSRNPAILFMFMGALLVVRTLPVFISLRIWPETSSMNLGQQISTAIYCTMALPLIVAITSVAVDAQAMSADTASVLVCAGALTVLIVPLVTAATIRISAIHPVEAAIKIAHDPTHFGEIYQEHTEAAKQSVEDLYTYCSLAKHEGHYISACEYLARPQEVELPNADNIDDGK